MNAAVWLDQLHALAVRFSGSVMNPAALGLMVADALWFFLFVLGVVAGGVDD